MTEEEWSLKGKRYFIAVDNIDGVFLVTEKRMKQGDDATFVYKENDIETLRQKLIEDLNNQIKEIGMFPEDTDCRKTCKKIIMSELRKVRNIINKRFGVKDD